MTHNLPASVAAIIAELERHGYEAAVVGGCVRDVLLGREPKDWDVATSATPEQIQKVFPKSIYENRFGTVGVWQNGELIEVTTYRTEAGYDDARHPDRVEFGRTLEEDLARRDFTINAMALKGDQIIDPFGGQPDLQKKLIRAVGDPTERFKEDALRLMRAVRFAAELGFTIEPNTHAALTAAAPNLAKISAERIRDELMKLIASPDPARGIQLMHETGLLQIVIPELLEGETMHQPRHHKFPVLEHCIRSLQHVPSDDPLVRLAALLHDVGKPRSAEGDDANRTFHGHEVIGAKLTREVMKRLKFSKDDIQRVTNLVRHHMFLFQFESTDKAVRRIIRRVGPENVDDLVKLRVGDRLGSGTEAGMTKKLQIFLDRVVDVQKDPIDTRMLAIDGNDIMKLLKIKPGPIIGKILNQLLEEVLDDPARNTKEHLCERATQLATEYS